MLVSPNRQISFQMVGQVGLTVSCPTGYDDKDWEAYIQQARHVRSAGGVIRGVLNFTPSQGASASQRKRLTDELKEELKPVVRVAVLSDSALLRGVITAMSWFVGGDLTTKSYRPWEYPQAIDWLADGVHVDPQALTAALLEQLQVMGYDPATLEYTGS